MDRSIWVGACVVCPSAGGMHFENLMRTQSHSWTTAQSGSAGFWINSWPWRLLNVTRSCENLSSGENRAVYIHTHTKTKAQANGRHSSVNGSGNCELDDQMHKTFAARSMAVSPGCAEWVGMPEGAVFCSIIVGKAQSGYGGQGGVEGCCGRAHRRSSVCPSGSSP